MMNLHMEGVPSVKVETLREIAAKQHNFYTGYLRQFIAPDGEIFCIDTRYDDELIAAGLLEPDA